MSTTTWPACFIKIRLNILSEISVVMRKKSVWDIWQKSPKEVLAKITKKRFCQKSAKYSLINPSNDWERWKIRGILQRIRICRRTSVLISNSADFISSWGKGCMCTWEHYYRFCENTYILCWSFLNWSKSEVKITTKVCVACAGAGIQQHHHSAGQSLQRLSSYKGRGEAAIPLHIF